MSATAECQWQPDRLRLLLLLDACEAADLTPIPVMRLHALAFLSNVLSPIWSVNSYDGKILKRRGGPFYPELQSQLDRLVGLGLVGVHDVRHIEEEGKWRIEAKFSVNPGMADTIIADAQIFVDERSVTEFFRRLAFAISRLRQPLEELVKFDATWSDPRTGAGDVIDFSEWRRANYSVFAARMFENLSAKGVKIGRGDKLNLYMRFMERKATSGAGKEWPEAVNLIAR
jgi:hypothetical protein